MGNDFNVEVMNWDIVNVPLYHHAKDGYSTKNWMATVKPDEGSAYGLDRAFLQRSRKNNHNGIYIVPKNATGNCSLRTGDVVEFGSTVTSNNKAVLPLKHKWYGVVTGIDIDKSGYGNIILKQADTTSEAFEFARVYSGGLEDTSSEETTSAEALIAQKTKEISKLEGQKNAILRRIAVLQAEKETLLAEVGTENSIPETTTYRSATEELFATFQANSSDTGN